MGNNFIPRLIFDDVASHLKEQEITVIIGARQVGKTTLLLQLKDYLFKKNFAKAEDIKIFNLDLITDLELFSSQKNFINYLKIETQDRKRLYVFVDEVQRLVNPGLFFKGIYDLRLPLKLVLTGSSSLEIKAKIQESLTGRKRLFSLYPFSFNEFIVSTDLSLDKVINSKKIIPYYFNQIMDKLFEYLVYGGYPRVVKESKPEEKYQILKEIYSSYVEKDVVNFLRIREALSFSRLTSLLASQIGQLVNTSEISNTLDIKQDTTQGYMRVLEQTFICRLLRPFFRNVRKELTKMPKIYFWDNGLRNFALESFRDFERREDRGILLENFVFSELGRQQSSRIRYWRTKDKSEVDFVLEHPSGAFIPIEVKAQRLKRPELPRSLLNFIKRYAPRQSFVINLGLRQKIKIGKTEVFFIYPFQINDILKNF